MKSKNEIKILISLIALLLVTISFSSAFTSRKKVIDNHIIFGDLELELIENTLDESGKEVPFKEGENDISTVETVSRIVRVENVCDNDMYVRIALDAEGIESNGKAFDCDNLISYDINTNDWIYRDGYYYYNHVLEKRESTNNLFENITFDTSDMTANHADSKVNVDIVVQAVQSAHNADNVLDAEGWPE